MRQSREGLFIEAAEVDIRSDCHEIPETEGIEGGVICTGFIDVEKILRRVTRHGHGHRTQHFFLEKKLPFQLVWIAFESDDGDASGSDCSGRDSSGGDSSGRDSSGGDSSGRDSSGSDSSGGDSSGGDSRGDDGIWSDASAE